MPKDLFSGKSVLVLVMAWCHQATSHYLNLCWPRFPAPTPYGVTLRQPTIIHLCIQTNLLQTKDMISNLALANANDMLWYVLRRMLQRSYKAPPNAIINYTPTCWRRCHHMNCLTLWYLFLRFGWCIPPMFMNYLFKRNGHSKIAAYY